MSNLKTVVLWMSVIVALLGSVHASAQNAVYASPEPAYKPPPSVQAASSGSEGGIRDRSPHLRQQGLSILAFVPWYSGIGIGVMGRYEIPVALDASAIRSTGLGDLEERFNALHEQLYGFRMHATASEIVNLRAIGNGSVQKPELPTGEDAGPDASGAVVEEHQILFEGENVPTRIYDRSKLSPGARIAGPAVVTEFDSTTVVLPGFTAEVDIHFNLLINPGA